MEHIGTRKHGTTWEYYFECPKQNGKRIRIFKSGYLTQSQALEAGKVKYYEYQKAGKLFKPSKIALIEFLNIWMENDCKKNLAADTIKSYTNIINKIIKPKFRKFKIKSITPSIIQDFFDNCLKDKYPKTTATKTRLLLNRAFNYAITSNLIISNPLNGVKIDYIKPAKHTTRIKKVHTELPQWLIEKIFERFPEGSSTYLPMMFAYKLGTRPGESFAIIWEDIDFCNKTIIIKRQIIWDEQTKTWTFRRPKTKYKRCLKLDDELIEILTRARNKQILSEEYYDKHYTYQFVNDKDQLNSDGVGRKINLVCVRENGTFINPRTMHNTATIIHKTFNYPNFDMYSLCYTHDKIEERKFNLNK